MKLYSWNVNGIRAALKKGYGEWFAQIDADAVCLQETKAEAGQLPEHEREPQGFAAFWNSSKTKKGYSGVAAFSRVPVLKHATGLPDPAYQGEGRLQHLEYGQFHLLNVYFPNGQMNEERLQYKLGYYDAFLNFAQELRQSKPVVVCGDFNTAHKEIDIARPKENEKTSGFLPIERAWMDRFVEAGYVDTLRLIEPETRDLYTWWSFRANARARNVGWRIDYFFVSEELRGAVKNAWIEPQVMGSDHCPLGLELAV